MQGTRRRPYYLRDKKITLLPRFTLRWDAGEDSENSYRLVQRHKTGADELTLQTIWHAAKGTRSKSVVRVFLSLHPDDARGVVQSIETHGGSAAVIPSLLAPPTAVRRRAVEPEPFADAAKRIAAARLRRDL
jgi:hypothetical protein